MRLILITLFPLLCAAAASANAASAIPASAKPTYASPQDSQDAWALFRNRDYARALERFEKKEANLYPDWEVVHDAMGWCHFFLEDYTAAEAKFKKALQIDPNYKWSLQGLQALEDLHAAPLQAAQDALIAGRYSEARAAFQRIQEGLTVAPKDDVVAAMIGEAWCLYYLGRAKDAKTIFRQAQKKKRGDAECYFGIGYCDYALADYRNALASLELGLKAEPGNYLAQIMIGWSYYWRQKYDKAIEAFDDASNFADADWQAWSGRAWSYLRNNDKALARNDFETSVQKSPYAFDSELRKIAEADPNWRALIRMAGWSALRLQLNSWAQSEFEAAIALDPTDVDAKSGLAFAHFRQGAYDQAVAQIQKLNGKAAQAGPWQFPVVSADGSTSNVAMNLQSLLSWCQLRLGAYPQALAGFREVRRNHPTWVDPICGEGWTLYTQGDYAGAEAVFAAAEKTMPGYSDATSGTSAVQTWRYQEYNDAWSLLLAGSSQAARTAFEQVLNQDGYRFPKQRDDLLHASIAWTWMEEDKTQEASLGFAKALELAPASSLALRGLAKLKMNNRQWSQAVEAYQAALKNDEVASIAEVHAELGWCHFKMESMLAAKNAFTKAQELDQNCATALAGMATLQLKREEAVEARLTWERALSLDPDLAQRWQLHEQMEDHPELQKLHSALGWIWYYRSDYVQAEKEFMLARLRDPNERTVLRGLGMLMLNTDRVEEGVEALQEYLSQRPESESGWGVWSSTTSALAWALYQAGDFKNALEHFRAVAELHRGQKIRYADPYDGAGWCLLRLGKYSQAKKEFLNAIEITPRHESSLQGLEAVAEEIQ